MELSENVVVRELYRNIKNYCQEMKLENSLKALPYAYEKHDGVKRIGGIPYIIHPLEVAWQGILIGVNSDIEIASALLHDVPEDCNTDLNDLGIDPIIKYITCEILNVHKFESSQWDKHERNRLYFEAIKKNEIATILKFGDTDNNLSTMNQDFTLEKKKKNVIEKKEFMYPLLEDALKLYRNNPDRVKQIMFYKQRIHMFVSQLEDSLNEPVSQLQRKRFIA